MVRMIETKNLSKKYLIYHELQSSYSTIVETLSRAAGRFFNQMLRPFKKNRVPPTQACEEFWALRDINVEIHQGDRIGIIGKNGAGKSTFLKILSRIVEPSSGCLKIGGRVASLLEVGTGFHPELTGRENIFLNGAILGMSKREIQKKFDEIVAFSEIEQFLDTPVKRYSSGMYTRLGFAVAAHLDPDILIIDEVLAVGDVQFQEKCFKKINELGNSIRTVLFVTHNVQALSKLCNKAFYFEKGKIKIQGPVDECVNEYLKTTRPAGLHWEGDLGDDLLRISAARLLGSDSNEFFCPSKEATLLIDYEVFKESKDFILGFVIYNLKGQMIARTFVGDESPIFFSFSSKGKHRISFSFSLEKFRDEDYLVYICYSRMEKGSCLNGEIPLKMSIFTQNKTAFSMRNVQMDGLFLGSHWKLE